jgi:hypothetical protein
MSGGPFDAVFQIAGRVIGSTMGAPYAQFRATNGAQPTSGGNRIATLACWITADMEGKARLPEAFAKPIVYGQFDPTLAQVGDYLIGQRGTFFVASINPPDPMQLVRCNRTASFFDTTKFTAKGLNTGYGGDIEGSETQLAAGWPCWMERGTKGDRGDANLPGDAKLPWFNVIVPNIPGVILRNNLILLSDQGFRHIISSVEQSPLGQRLVVKLATT